MKLRLGAAALVTAALMLPAQDNAPPRPGLSDAGVKREMADVQPAAEIHIEGMPDWQVLTADAVWVANRPANALHRIDPATNQVIATIPVGKQPCSGLAAGFGSIWSPSCADKTVVRVDAATNRVTATIPIGPAEKEGSIAVGAGAVWMVSDSKGALSRIDPATNRVAAQLQVPAGSVGCLFAEDAVWVTAPAANSLTRVDPSAGQSSNIAVGTQPRFLTAGAGSIWTLNQGDGTVTRVDARSGKVLATIPVGVPGPGGDITFGNGRVWVTVLRVPLSEIDPAVNRVVRQWTGGGGDAVRLGFGSIWLSNVEEQNVWRINPEKLK
jgi:YVTN family beta-propeller protein